MPKNEALEAMFNKEKVGCEENQKKLERLAWEIGIENDAYHKLEPLRTQALGHNEGYCATHVYEFVAETICLLMTGHAKSEYTISRGFKDSFEIVKQMYMEAQ